MTKMVTKEMEDNMKKTTMRINVMTFDKKFMEDVLKEEVEKIKIEKLRPVVLSLSNDHLYKKIAIDLCSELLRDFEKQYQEQNQRMSVFASFFNERSAITGTPFYSLNINAEINGDEILTYIEVIGGSEALHFIIKDSFMYIPNAIEKDEKLKEDFKNTSKEILANMVDGVSTQAVQLLMKNELKDKENEILLALAFGVHGPSLSEFAEELLEGMKKSLEPNEDNKK